MSGVITEKAEIIEARQQARRKENVGRQGS
jgi:hypothetical protein